VSGVAYRQQDSNDCSDCWFDWHIVSCRWYCPLAFQQRSMGCLYRCIFSLSGPRTPVWVVWTPHNSGTNRLADGHAPSSRRCNCDHRRQDRVQHLTPVTNAGYPGSMVVSVLFAGLPIDLNGAFYYVRHRAYHPALGRWFQRDPAGYIDGLNLYEYVRSRPVGATDPRGLWKIEIKTMTVIIEPGDRLWNIARDLTGSGANWKEIFPEGIDPTKIYPGDRIPVSLGESAPQAAEQDSQPAEPQQPEQPQQLQQPPQQEPPQPEGDGNGAASSSTVLSLDEVAWMVAINRPAGVHEKYRTGLMLCLLWKESSFDSHAANRNSSARGIAQILGGTANDIQDRVGPKRFGITSNPFYTLAKDERLIDHRFEADVSIYAAFLYLEDRRLFNGGDWKEGVKAYGPNGDKVIECSECCGIVKFDESGILQNPKEVQECLNKIHP